MKFYIISGIFLLLGSLTSSASPCKSLPCISVEIYYESLCKSCHYFFKNQLAPSYPAYKDHLIINFIPYGKASHTRYENAYFHKQWLFSCEHGESECQGNKAQACALEVIKESSASTSKQKHSVDLVNCVMSSTSPATSVLRCAKTIGLSESARKKINKCDESSAGSDLLAALGDKTHSLRPPLRSVPRIVINGVYSDKHQNEALHNFKGLICDLLKKTGKKIHSCSIL